MFNYVLIAVGLILVAASFFVSERLDEKLNGKEPEAGSQGKDVWTEKDEKAVSERIETILSEKSEETVVRADDELSQISNEKIMAVSEFSDQILEKMEQNHSEVIFLYNMLGEKEEEIKRLVNKPVTVKEVPVKAEEALKKETEADDAKKTEAPSQMEGVLGQEAVSMAATEKKASASENKSQETEDVNQNDRILGLHKEGKTVLEISRELGLGQGEVKLVIDLFQGVDR